MLSGWRARKGLKKYPRLSSFTEVKALRFGWSSTEACLLFIRWPPGFASSKWVAKSTWTVLWEELPYHPCLTRRGGANTPAFWGLEGLASGTQTTGFSKRWVWWHLKQAETQVEDECFTVFPRVCLTLSIQKNLFLTLVVSSITCY